ncbi:YitT family protein [Bacillus sp. EAC]|uniref:YitT family protein n=1 Tax=Bacillus sp. EAC TaxID=1978338 RepID=UPI000B43BAF2|nr:YitT family protein [Bacillus sp. EAC]
MAELKEETHKKTHKLKVFQRAIAMLIGAVAVATGLEIFLVPNDVIDGGITGISIMVSHLTGLPLGVFIFVLNLPFFYLGYKQIGKTFAISTIFGIIVLSYFTSMFHHIPAFTEDILLATIFGGMIVGVGVGLAIRFGGALDGIEILAIIINSKIPFSVGEIIMVFNLFILGAAGFIFSWDRAMYSIIAYLIAFKTIDIVVEGMEQSKSAWIISDKSEDIGEAILFRMGRGVTYISGRGAYTGENTKVIFCVITRLEEAELKSIVDDYDPNAFLAIADIAEVRGGRFKKKNVH